LTDGRGKRVYLSDAIIIMTSNLGAENFRKLTSPLGFLQRSVGVDQVEGEVMRELERRFPPEFRNRIDEVVLFAPLTHDEVREIARHYLQQVTLTLAKSGKTIEIEDAALELVVSRGYSMAFGARFLKRFIDEQIKLPISTRWNEGTHFTVTAKGEEISVEPAVAKMPSAHGALAFGDVA
jgi:ATP-dependent Clp protease ATP-binding subunit ClpA